MQSKLSFSDKIFKVASIFNPTVLEKMVNYRDNAMLTRVVQGGKDTAFALASKGGLPSAMSRTSDPNSWTHMDLYMLHLRSPDGTGYSFMDYYFQFVNREIPILSKACLATHVP